MYMESTGPLTINPHSLRLKADLPVVMQNLACAINSMVLCIFTTYGMMPRFIHELRPDGFAHRALAAAFERSGPLLRLAFGAKTVPVLWFEKWLTHITGERFTAGRLQEIGARIFNLERMYNLREGLTGADDTLPERILSEPTFPGMTAGHPLAALLPRYYALRGWDARGVPTPRTLARLQVRV
jgi:aldehyde:ferredoxin oxidoreductase